MRIAWVIGAGGLLGSALVRALMADGTCLYVPRERFRWGHWLELERQFSVSVREFSDQARAASRWEVYWAAGVGTMATTEGALDFEAKALSFLLGQLGAESRLLATEGGVGLASSAGAVYAGAVADLISEDVQPVPTTPYANAKLYQEGLVRAFAESHERVTALLARFSTLYGTGQSFGKKQGLIAHIARSVVRNAAIQIYVPFDTIRDYLIADDAAAGIATGLRALGRSQRIAVKIIASERPTTIAEIVSIFRRIARRPPRIVVSASNLTNLYAPRMVFRSRVLLHASRTPNTSLPIGISRVMRAERDSFVGGSVLHN